MSADGRAPSGRAHVSLPLVSVDGLIPPDKLLRHAGGRASCPSPPASPACLLSAAPCLRRSKTLSILPSRFVRRSVGRSSSLSLRTTSWIARKWRAPFWGPLLIGPTTTTTLAVTGDGILGLTVGGGPRGEERPISSGRVVSSCVGSDIEIRHRRYRRRRRNVNCHPSLQEFRLICTLVIPPRSRLS